MDSPINRIDDLLSGMLDGMLSEDESIELDREMVKDPSIEARLDELIALRKSLMSGRSRQGLGPDFASSVTNAARNRALEMGADAPDWLKRDRAEPKIEKTLAPSTTNSAPPLNWVMAGIFSIAATLVIAFFVLPKKGSDFTGEGLVQVPELSDSKSDLGDTPKIATNPAPIKPTIPETNQTAESQTVESKAKLLEAELLADAKADPVELNFESKTTLVDPVDLPKSDMVATAPNSKPNPKQPPKNNKLSPFLMVFDLTIEPQAVENRVIEKILDKYGIVFTDDLVLSENQLANLEEAQWVGKPETIKQGVGDIPVSEKDLVDSKPVLSDEKMGILFLQCTARNLDSALGEMILDIDNFPSFSLDMAQEESVRLLVQQLSDIQVADSPNGFAGRLAVASSRGNPTPFAAASPRGKPMAKPIRNSFKGLTGASLTGSTLPEHQEMSNVLFLLRPTKK